MDPSSALSMMSKPSGTLTNRLRPLFLIRVRLLSARNEGRSILIGGRPGRGVGRGVIRGRGRGRVRGRGRGAGVVVGVGLGRGVVGVGRLLVGIL